MESRFSYKQQHLILDYMANGLNSTDALYIAAVLFPEISYPSRIPKHSYQGTSLIKQNFVLYPSLTQNGFIWGVLPFAVNFPCFFTIGEYDIAGNPGIESDKEKTMQFYETSYDELPEKYGSECRVVSCVVKIQYTGPGELEQGLQVCSHINSHYPAQLNTNIIDEAQQRYSSRPSMGARLCYLPQQNADFEFFPIRKTIHPYIYEGQVGDDDQMEDYPKYISQKWNRAADLDWGYKNPSDTANEENYFPLLITPQMYRGLPHSYTKDAINKTIGLVEIDLDRENDNIQLIDQEVINSQRLHNKIGTGRGKIQADVLTFKPYIMGGYFKGMFSTSQELPARVNWLRIDVQRTLEIIPTGKRAQLMDIQRPETDKKAIQFIQRPEIRETFSSQSFGPSSMPLHLQKDDVMNQGGMGHINILERQFKGSTIQKQTITHRPYKQPLHTSATTEAIQMKLQEDAYDRILSELV